jgi:uncharacterized protein YegJ (DUF2314 family)
MTFSFNLFFAPTTLARLLYCWPHGRRALLQVLVAAAFCVLAGCSRSKEGDNYTHVQSADVAMNAAIDKAKSTVGQFLSAFREQKAGTRDFFVKKPYPTPSGGHEHMWIAVLEEKEGVLRGRVANEAEDTREVKMGQTVSVKVSEISDWKYQDHKKLVGGYTIKYFVERMSPKEREAFLKEAGFEL